MRHWTELENIAEVSAKIDWSKIPGGTPEEWEARKKFARDFGRVETRDEARRRRNQAKQKVRARAQALMKAAKCGPCADCGQRFHPDAMEFDHRTGEKQFGISRGKHFHPVRLMEELQKCDCVCACCHRVRTARRRAGLPAILPPPDYMI